MSAEPIAVDGAAPSALAAPATTATNSNQATNNTIAPAVPSSSLSSSLLAQFDDTLVQRVDSAVGDYRKRMKKLKEATAALDRFKQICNRESPNITLPTSLKLNLVKAAKLPPVEGQPDFHKECTSALQQIERETNKQVYEALLQAKQKHITHLQPMTNVPTFITATCATFNEFAQQYATDIDSRCGSGAFPLADAKSKFQSQLEQCISDVVLRSVQHDREEREKQEHMQQQDHQAQERVLAGIGTGETIKQVALQTVEQQLQPVRQKLQHLARLGQRNQLPLSHSSPSTRTRPTSTLPPLHAEQRRVISNPRNQYHHSTDYQQRNRKRRADSTRSDESDSSSCEDDSGRSRSRNPHWNPKRSKTHGHGGSAAPANLSSPFQLHRQFFTHPAPSTGASADQMSEHSAHPKVQGGDRSHKPANRR